MKTPASRTPIYKHPALYVVLFVVFSWALYGYFIRDLDYGTLGVWGDSFGYINSLFTGLALAGIVAAYWHEREQARSRDVEQERLLSEMRAQVKAACHTGRIQALTAMIANDHRELEGIHIRGVDVASGSAQKAMERQSALRNRIRLNREKLEELATVTELF